MMLSPPSRILGLLGCVLLPLWGVGLRANPGPGAIGRQDPEPAETPQPTAAAQEARAQVEQGMLKAGIYLDLQDGVLASLGRVEVIDKLLEYLVVLPHGDAHEAMFTMGGDRTVDEAVLWAEVLNAGLLALGLQPGNNAVWTQKDPAPTEDELRNGVSPYDVQVPTGDSLYLYVAWRVEDELYLFRMEDLIRDLERGRSMRRQAWVYLGSRMLDRGDGRPEVFAAGIEGNLVNISFFAKGNTLVTGALPECVHETIWLPNAWLLPPMGSDVLMIFSRQRLDGLSPELASWVPSGS